MLRSRFALQAPHPKALSFLAGEKFLPLHSPSDEKEWWLVLSDKADVGYIPKNYVTLLPAGEDEVAQFVAEARHQLVRRLPPEKRASQLAWLDQLTARRGGGDAASAAPAQDNSFPPSVGPETKKGSPMVNGAADCERPPAPEAGPGLPAGLGRRLVELVRQHTAASHQASLSAVQAVLRALAETAPSAQPVAEEALSQLAAAASGAEPPPEGADGRRLRQLLSELGEAAAAWQQRSWKLEDDEPTLVLSLKELTSLLADADPAESRRALEREQLAGPLSLAQLYQAEPGATLRRPLSRALALCCGLSRSALSALLASPLPSELAREIQSSLEDDVQLSHAALLLSMLLSMGEKLPISHLDLLGPAFSAFLLETLERPPAAVTEDSVDLLLSVLLALNLQDEGGTQLRAAVAAADTTRALTEKLMLLFNREEDPVRVFDHEPAPEHSVVKALVDLFADRAASRLFYTNDVRVLVDIVTRNLADLSPGDARRQEYLRLCGRLLDTDDYGEHRHRSGDIASALRRIAAEELQTGEAEQARDTQLAATLLALHRQVLTDAA